MRNLKKVLSLVLCVAMMLSVMVVGALGRLPSPMRTISPLNYAEAAEVLDRHEGIMQGYDDGSFLPQRNINSRAGGHDDLSCRYQRRHRHARLSQSTLTMIKFDDVQC